jgi:hypothetical protein
MAEKAALTGTLTGIVTENTIPATARTKATQLKTRVAWWKDGPDPLPIPISQLFPWDQIWHEWYVFKEKGETLATAKDRWAREMDLSLATHCTDLAGIPQYYPRDIFSDQECVDIIAATLEFFRGYPRLKIFSPFEYDRGTMGISGNAAIGEMYKRTLSSCVMGRPKLAIPFPPVPPPPPIVDNFILTLLMKGHSTMANATRVISGGQLKAANGGFAIIISNPVDVEYLGMPPVGTVLTGGPMPDPTHPSVPCVLSIIPGGQFQCRDVNAVGSWETAKKVNGNLVFSADGTGRWVVPYAD